MKRPNGRRTFLRLIAAAAALPIVGRLLPRRWTQAARAPLGPGPVRELDEAEVLRPGGWAG